jgi:hypothetical protein
MYTLGIKLADDTVLPAKRYADLDTAQGTMEFHYHRSIRADEWAGLIIINDDTGETESEMEW